MSKAKQICPMCERPSIDGVTHVKCKKKFGLDGLISIWVYEGVIRKAILGLKYKFATDIASELTEKMEKVIRKGDYFFPRDAVLVPIPLYWFRENWRGFNQAKEVGKLLAEKMSWKFIPDLLIRNKLRKPQTDLKAEDRQENIKGVFKTNPNFKYQISNEKSFILFDDVSTTGSTLKEAGKVLKRNRAKSVWGLTIAR